MTNNVRYSYYTKRIPTPENGNIESRDREESKLNSTIIVKSGTHTLTDDQ